MQHTELADLKEKLTSLENLLTEQLIVFLTTHLLENKNLDVYLTSLLFKKTKKATLWKSKEFLITLKNAKYGFNNLHARSSGGSDGIFLLDRHFKPTNEMQKKIFDQFIDKSTSDYLEILNQLALKNENIQGVRVVSHHMRLLGILHISPEKDTLVLIDFDNNKH